MFLVRLIDVFVGIIEFVFRPERRGQGSSPATLGAAGIITLVALMVIAVGVPQWSYRSATSPYVAELATAEGLTTNDPVLVAGVPAGRIEAIRLAGDRVRVEFRLDDAQPLGDQTRAGVRLRTVLGKRYLNVAPAGHGDVGEDNTIPLARTDASFTLDDFSAAAVDSSASIDPTVVRAMMSTMKSLVPDSGDLSTALTGAGGAALAIAGTGRQLDQLLTVAQRLADVTSRQAETVSSAFANTQTIVQTLAVRRVVLVRLTDNLRRVLDTMAATFPTVPMAELTTNLVSVTDTLARNTANIDAILTNLPPSMRTIVDSTGNGNWADVVSPSAVIPDGLLCVLGVMQGCTA